MLPLRHWNYANGLSKARIITGYAGMRATDPNIQAGAVTPAIDISTSKLASMMLRIVMC